MIFDKIFTLRKCCQYRIFQGRGNKSSFDQIQLFYNKSVIQYILLKLQVKQFDLVPRFSIYESLKFTINFGDFDSILVWKLRGWSISITKRPWELIFGHSYFYPMAIKWWKFELQAPTLIFWTRPVFSGHLITIY